MWPNPQETATLVIFTEEILNGNLVFGTVLCHRNPENLTFYSSILRNFGLIASTKSQFISNMRGSRKYIKPSRF